MAKKHTPRSTASSAPNSGFTMIEMLIVMTIMSVAVFIFSSTVTAGNFQRRANRGRSIAVNAAQSVLESMRNEKLRALYPLYNGDPNDDPDGAGTAHGEYFEVMGLKALDGEGTAMGRIEMPSVYFDGSGGSGGPGGQIVTSGSGGSSGAGNSGQFGSNGGQAGDSFGNGEEWGGAQPEGWQLREDWVNEHLDLPRDLNGDSMIDHENHGHDFVILPLRITVEWLGANGPSKVEMSTIMSEFRR